MTTFDFSIHRAPTGRGWEKQFTNRNDDRSPESLIESLGPFDISGWQGHRVFVDWSDRERLKRHTPDWCLHVVKCSRGQLSRFAEACRLEGMGSDSTHAALRESIAGLNGDSFVIRVLEF